MKLQLISDNMSAVQITKFCRCHTRNWILRSWTALRYVTYCLDYSVNWNVTSKFYNTVAYILALLSGGRCVEGGGGYWSPLFNWPFNAWFILLTRFKGRNCNHQEQNVVSAPEIEPLTFCVRVGSDVDALSERQEIQSFYQLLRRRTPFLDFRGNLKRIWMGLNVWWMCLVTIDGWLFLRSFLY